LIEEHLIDITEQRKRWNRENFEQTLETAVLFAGGVAHDLNNMLNILDGYLLLSQEAIDPTHRTQEYFEESRKAIERASRLTGELLEFSKMERQSEDRDIDLRKLLEDLEKCARIRLGETTEMAVTLPERLPLLRGNPDELFDALFNLISNSADALARKGGVIHLFVQNLVADFQVSARSSDFHHGDRLVIEVIDNGGGIPKEILHKVHQPFFSTKKEEGGSGLGLAIVYRAVREMGGTVEIHSARGLGTSVEIQVPIANKKDGG